MSQFETGLEEIGLGAAQANALYNANLQRLNWLLFGESYFLFGAPVDGAESAGDIRPFDRVIKYVLLQAHDSAALPSEACNVQIRVGSALLSQQYSLGSGQSHALVAVTGDGNGGPNPFSGVAGDVFSGPGVLVPSSSVLRVRVTNAANVLNLSVTLLWRPRKP